MPIITTAGAAVSALNSALGIVKALRGAPPTEVQGKLLDLQQALSELQLRHMELVQENQTLSSQVRELSERNLVEAVLQYHYGCYWKPLEDGTLDGPFSASRWDNDKKLIRLRFWQVANANEFGPDGPDGPLEIQFKDHPFDDEICVPVAFITERKVMHLKDHFIAPS